MSQEVKTQQCDAVQQRKKRPLAVQQGAVQNISSWTSLSVSDIVIFLKRKNYNEAHGSLLLNHGPGCVYLKKKTN